MSVPQCPKDFIVVTIDKKFQDETISGLLLDPTYRPGHHATVTGKVLTTPRGLSNHSQKKVINMEVLPGDEIAFAYRVIYNQDAMDNATDIFYEDPSDSAYVTKWSNKEGKHLLRRYKKGGKFDVALYTIDRGKGVIIDKIENCSKTVANDFIGKYMPDRNHSIVFRNCLWNGNEEYWKVDYQMAYIAKRNDKMIMIGGHALLECPVGGIKRQEYTGNLEVWGETRRKVRTDLHTKLLAIGTPLKGQPKLSVEPGDTVVVNSETAQEYTFWGKDYLLVRQDQLLAKI
jgi:co-chaperonin GroES (HSP10)